MPTPADRIVAMPRSGIREIMDLAAGLPDVVHLEVGQPDFRTPPHIVAAAVAAAEGGYHGYTPNKGLPVLREAIVGKLARENAITATIDEIVVGCGAINVLYESLVAVVDPGDAILVPDPGWPNYAMIADLLSARAVGYALDPAAGYEPDLEHLARLLADEPRVRAIVLNSPNNPSGAVYDPAIVHGVVDLAERFDVYVVSDECYERIVFDGADAPLPREPRHLGPRDHHPVRLQGLRDDRVAPGVGRGPAAARGSHRQGAGAGDGLRVGRLADGGGRRVERRPGLHQGDGHRPTRRAATWPSSCSTPAGSRAAARGVPSTCWST